MSDFAVNLKLEILTFFDIFLEGIIRPSLVDLVCFLYFFNFLYFLNFLYLRLDVRALFRVQSCHIDVGVFGDDSLLVLQTTLLQDLAARLLKHIVNLVLDGLIDLILTW